MISCKEGKQKKVIVNNTDTITTTDTTLKNDDSKEIASVTIDTLEKNDYQTTSFDLVKKFPVISDTPNFIKELKENCHLDEHRIEEEKINFFKKTKLYGSNKEFYIVEYDYSDGPTCAFPWKYQIVFNTSGKLIDILSAIRIDIVKIFPNDNPFLIQVSSTGHGNGGHEIYRINCDTLQNILDGFLGYYPKTYDSNEDCCVNKPYEFHYKISDANNDGYKDITFYGEIVLIQGRTKQGDWYDYETINGKEVDYSLDNPYKTIPAAYTFLYDHKRKHFIEKEDYSKKYEYIFGDTK
ncbi:MAG: hypothetical protein ABI402_11675 [Ferruginibacter sp.]